MKINDFDLDIVVQGFPGKSVCHGGLGWSTVVVLRATAASWWSIPAASACARCC
jgi:hypothetical protein